MKKVLLFLLVLLALNVNAQKVKYEGLNLNYIQLPLKPLPVEYENYSVKYHDNIVQKTSLGSVIAENGIIKFDAYTFDKDFYDFMLVYESQPLIEKSQKANDNSYTHQVDGKTVTVSKKSYTVQYYTTAILTVIDKNYNVIDSIFISDENDIYEFTTNEFETLDKAYSEASSTDFLEKSRKKVKNDCDDLLRDTSISLYDYKLKDHNFKIGFVNNKKGEYDDLDEAYNIMTNIFNSYNGTNFKVIDSKKDSINLAIDIWTKALGEMDKLNKKARINEEHEIMLYHNLSIGYFLLNDFENCLKYVELNDNIYKNLNKVEQLKILNVYTVKSLIPQLITRMKIHGF